MTSSDTMLLIMQRISKFMVLLLGFIMLPIVKIQYFKKQRRLPPIKNKLLLISATEIAQKIRKKEVSCETVIATFIERCKEVNPILNAIVENRFDAAIEEARKVDEFMAHTTKTEAEIAEEKPLLGVPVTVKESVAVKGMSNVAGVKARGPYKAEQDAAAVSRIRNAGAIILLVSNTPEFCTFWESYNYVTGATWNPYNSKRIAGGSSGGEAALLGSAASLLSIGSDIAGSIRVPALFCGVFGHKPSGRLVPHEGHYPSSTDENWPQYFNIGPLARYAKDLPLIMKILSQPKNQHQFDQKISLKSLKFFYMDVCCPGTHPINEDTKMAIKKLQAYIETTYGVEVQKAHLKDMKFAFDIATYSLTQVNVDDISKIAKFVDTSKAILEFLKCLVYLSPYTLSTVGYVLLKWIWNKFPRIYGQKITEKKILLEKQFQELLGENGILIYPTFVSPPGYLFQSYSLCMDYTYAMIYNVYGMPATHCTMGLNKEGFPVGVQIIAKQGNDHLTIAVAQEIEKVFGGWQAPSACKLD
ncbi:fatty-acid amide hydrolase 2-B-like [Xylocopa sonorina]|uniref:fatty-acid amide hydrolase 2-B-like n=1 Tax=Xylocopa sonorina TaxID=1818115 RepID=UPI00403AFBE3